MPCTQHTAPETPNPSLNPGTCTQAIQGGCSGVCAWNLDDAMHTGGGYGKKNLKGWGFWNSAAGQDGYHPHDFNIRPWFRVWSMLCRSFPAGEGLWPF